MKIRLKKILGSSNVRGFTLIELLIVIALIGVLASVILIFLDPVEQFNKAKDAGKKATVAQLGNAIQGYRISRGDSFLVPSNTWLTTLVSAGELKTVPTGGLATSTNCAAVTGVTVGLEPTPSGYCYKTDATATVLASNGIVYTTLESKSEKSKCPGTDNASYFVWSSADNGKSGIVCSIVATGPVPAAQSWWTP